MISLAAFINVFYFSYQALYSLMGSLVLGAFGLVVFGLLSLWIIGAIEGMHKGATNGRRMSIIAATVIFILLSAISAFLISRLSDGGLMFFIANIFLLISSYFAGLTYKRSKYLDSVIGKILGFKDFLIVAEKEKFEALVNENPSYFYDVMPYAFVLNISDKWMDKFKGIEIEAPDWYTPYGHDVFWDYYMMTHLYHHMYFMNETASAVEFDNDSGGFGGGGGFSGGGFGGGGGGSW